MGRIKEKPQILFKNSNNTFNTYSKTCSAFSEAVTKSIIMQLKNKIKNNNYYDDRGTIKRDLSVETDICILRRYVKENKSKIHNKHSSCARFKYSINNTDKGVIEESKADTSACGDSQCKIENAHLKVDLTTLVVDNLKTLLNDWITKYLLENDKTKQKIATVLDSLLHKVELEHSSTSGTYTVDVEVINETQTTDSITSKSKKGQISIKSRRKLSSQTVPLTGKRVKLISTLSVPKISLNNKKNRYNRTYVKYYKGSVNRLFSTSSSCNILEIKTESLTKRCATYQNLRWEKSSIQKQFNFVQEPTPISSTQFLNKNESDDVIKEIKQEESISQHDNTKVFGNKKHLDKSPSAKIKPKGQCRQQKNKITKRHQITYPTFHSTKGKKNSYQSKNVSQKTQKNRHINLRLLRHIKDVFTYFEKLECINDLKFDIHINISPDIKSNKSNNNSSQHANSEIKNNTKLICNTNPVNLHTKTIHSEIKSSDMSKSSRYQFKIISLLDGAMSQNRYLLSQKDTTEIPRNRDQETGTSGIEFLQDISEIKKIIKDLVSVAEHMAKEQNNKHNKLTRNIATEIITPRSTSRVSKNSIAIQCVTTETNNVLTSGLNLKKESQKKDMEELNFNPRLTKKSTSYRIIESESLLQIHDLTSRPKKIIEKSTNDLLQTEHLPKSKSILDVPTVINHNRKLLAFYCDKCIKSKQCVFNSCNHNVPYANMYSTCGCKNHYDNFRRVKVEHCPNINYTEGGQKHDVGNCCVLPGKTCIDAEADAENSDSLTEIDGTCDKKFIVTKRSVGFKEGCFYCILLWIPVLIIMWLFYVFILKVYIESKESSTKSPQILISKKNTSVYSISMSDLGF